MNITTWVKTGTLALLLGIQACTPEEWAMAAGQPGTPVTPVCGATLSAGGNYMLDANLTNCANPAALTLVGPLTLDLNGHTISCINTTDPYRVGLLVGGIGTNVLNGTITNCGTGVAVSGSGKHKLSHITAQNNALGFRVLSDKNKLTSNTVIDNIYRGIRVEGSDNRLSRNTGINSDISIADTGVNNRLEKNTVTDTLYAYTDEGEDTKFIHNIADNNGSAGFYIASQSRNAQLISNEATNTDFYGFALSGEQTTMRKNTATNNGAGINVGSDKHHKISNNTALSNGLDLWEQTPGCGTNVWQNNTFVTESQLCIQ